MQPRSGDVFIASPPKCGTTWVCQLVQTLRSRGDMRFEVCRCAALCCAVLRCAPMLLLLLLSLSLLRTSQLRETASTLWEAFCLHKTPCALIYNIARRSTW